MRTFSSLSLILLALLFASVPSRAQKALPLPGCETTPAVRKILDEKLESNKLDKMKIAERLAWERHVLEDVIANYPRELEPYQTLVNKMRSADPDEFAQLRDRLVKMAQDHPDDPLALTLGGWVLRNIHTAESVRLLEAAKTKAPDFPWSYKELAGDYFSGKIADPEKVKENIEGFFRICPSSTDNYAQWLLAKDPALQPKVAAALRARLEKEPDQKRLQGYDTLWGLEFRVHPPAEHDAVRAQLTRDLKRLETLHPKGDAQWQALLIKGCKQSGASKDVISAREDALLREYPHSGEALDVLRDRWDKAHKPPEDQSDSQGWAKFRKEYEEALKGWVQDFPDDMNLQHFDWFYAISGDDTVLEKDGIAALDSFLQSVNDYEPTSDDPWEYQTAARFLIDHNWEPDRALDLAKKATAGRESERARDLENDNLSDQDMKDRRERDIWIGQFFNGLILKAAKQANRPEEAVKLKASLETPPPTDRKFQSGYWLNRARLEALENHTQDALAYYQLALQTRTDPPKAMRGKLQDDLTDEARALWKAQGGTETAWTVWSKPAASGTEQPSEGFWEKPSKAIPSFELSDMSGKTWRLKELGGKTLLISVWATWCGPCEAELPHLQKFYEKFKGRSDIQVLTFDIDEDLGLVAPYLKEKGYTFPVLPAYSTVVSLLDGFAIPQNWLVDPHGEWRWKQIGYGGGSDAEFEKDMLARLEALSASQ